MIPILGKYLCRWGFIPHSERRLRKAEHALIPVEKDPDQFRICTSCSRLREVARRKKSTNGGTA